MLHRVSFVARSNFLPEKELVEYATKHHNRHSVSFEGGVPCISTLFTDGLIAAFERDNPELCERFRDEQYALAVKERQAR